MLDAGSSREITRLCVPPTFFLPFEASEVAGTGPFVYLLELCVLTGTLTSSFRLLFGK